MKKIILITLIPLLLASCGSTTTDDANTKTYEWNQFKIDIPKAWTQVEGKELPNVNNGKIELALTSTEITAWFANNLVIISEDLQDTTTSMKYSNTNYIRTTWSVQEYVKLNEEEFKFSDDDSSKLYTFEAKYNTQTSKRKFLQTAKICSKKAYLLTIGINLDNTSISKYESLLKSFACITETTKK